MPAGSILVDVKITYDGLEPSTINIPLDLDMKIADLNTRLRSELGGFEQGNQDDSLC
jgi:hypothetical protein